MADLKVSIATYNEIANALDALGKKVEAGAKITLEKDDKIINPIDWRLVTLRRDTADIAAKVFEENARSGFIDFAAQFYEFVLTGNVPEIELVVHNEQKLTLPPKW